MKSKHILKNTIIGFLSYFILSIVLGIILVVITNNPMSGIFLIFPTAILSIIGLIAGVVLSLIFDENKQKKINIWFVIIFAISYVTILLFIVF